MPAHTERANATLAGNAIKLFSLLTHFKINSLQQHQAARFRVSQTRVSHLATVLLGMLNHMLHRRGLLPVRDGAALVQRLAQHTDKIFAYDGVERGVPRNAADETQAEEYSAKEAHCLKNTTLCDATQYVHFLSPTEDGRVHNKKIADEYPLVLPAGSVLR